MCRETHSALIRANNTAPDAAVCKYIPDHVSTSGQVINEANKSDIQLSVPGIVEEVHPVILCVNKAATTEADK